MTEQRQKARSSGAIGYWFGFFLFMAAGIPGDHGQELIVETAGPVAPANLGGFAVRPSNPAAFIGVRFDVDHDTQISRVGGHLNAWPGLFSGPVFTAIVRVDSPTAFPHGEPFEPSEVMGSALISLPVGLSEDVLVAMPLQLSSGSYLLIFGSGLYGATGEAVMPTVNPTLMTARFVSYGQQIGLPGFWQNSELTALGDPSHSVRMVVESVPEPTTWSLLVFATILAPIALHRRDWLGRKTPRAFAGRSVNSEQARLKSAERSVPSNR